MSKPMHAQEAIAYIVGAQLFGKKNGLRNMERLLARLRHPEAQVKLIHVAGTNGKGSTCAYIDTCLRAAGYRCGLYTSPYLETFHERIRLDGRQISDADLAACTQRVKDAADAEIALGMEHPTMFELATAVAFVYYAQQRADVAVIEVGLGGRLDPTNVIRPEVAVITPIGFDHMAILGDTLPAIAAEKAGIIKENTPVVVAAQRDEAVTRVFRAAAGAKHAPLLETGVWRVTHERNDESGQVFDVAAEDFALRGVRTALRGAHQITNAVTAIGALRALERKGFIIGEDAIRAGLAGTLWPGRLERIAEKPLVVLDGAHNVMAARVLCEALRALYGQKKIVFVAGILSDKDHAHILEAFVGVAERVYTVTVDNPRAISAEALAAEVVSYGVEACAYASAAEALRAAVEAAGADGVVVVSGSLYLVGEVRRLWRGGKAGL